MSKHLRWRLALILLSAVMPLGLLGLPARADSVRIHGIVQDDAYAPVSGGHVWLERQWGAGWPVAPCCDNKQMQGHAFGFDLSQPGRYRVMYEKDGYVVDWIRYDEFTLDTAPFGDILIVVKRSAIVKPTSTMEPTATHTKVPATPIAPTVTPTATPNAAVSYITLPPAVDDALMGHVVTALGSYVPATCFEIAARQKGCPLSVTQPWVAMVPVDGEVECYRFQPFSCPRRSGILLEARCQSPCDVAVVEGGEW